MCNQNQNLIIPLQRFLKCGVECEMWMKLDVDQGQPTNKKKLSWRRRNIYGIKTVPFGKL